MLSPINNAIALPVYNNKSVSCKGKYQLGTTKIQDSVDSLSKKTNKQKINSYLHNISFKALLAAAAKLFGRKLYFDENGKLNSIEKYVNNELKTVKHLRYGLIKPSSIDEYEGGKISKVTDFYSKTRIPHWIIEYSENGDNRTREYYENGDIKSIQYEKNDQLDSVAYYDKDGNYVKYEKYNPNETLYKVVKYETDKYVEESYNNGALMSVFITLKDNNVKRNIVYNNNQQIQYVMENGEGYSTYYHYDDGRKDWSETKYKNKNILYKKVEYDRHGNPTCEYHYDKNRILCAKINFPDPLKTVCTRYND